VPIAGGASFTVTVNEPEAVRVPESVTVQLTDVDPKPNTDPEAGVQTAGITPSSASVPLAAKLTTLLALVAVTTMSAGGAKVGAVFDVGAGDVSVGSPG
jgi:hypothetical protein